MSETTLQLPPDVESLSAEDVLRFVLERFPGKVALACSFQKEESVLLDMLFELEPKARVFAIDTRYLFPETYELWREVERYYGTTIEAFDFFESSLRTHRQCVNRILVMTGSRLCKRARSMRNAGPSLG